MVQPESAGTIRRKVENHKAQKARTTEVIDSSPTKTANAFKFHFLLQTLLPPFRYYTGAFAFQLPRASAHDPATSSKLCPSSWHSLLCEWAAKVCHGLLAIPPLAQQRLYRPDAFRAYR